MIRCLGTWFNVQIGKCANVEIEGDQGCDGNRYGVIGKG
jgi:hypothetical protein